jgi:hypothetical protein
MGIQCYFAGKIGLGSTCDGRRGEFAVLEDRRVGKDLHPGSLTVTAAINPMNAVICCEIANQTAVSWQMDHCCHPATWVESFAIDSYASDKDGYL